MYGVPSRGRLWHVYICSGTNASKNLMDRMLVDSYCRGCRPNNFLLKLKRVGHVKRVRTGKLVSITRIDSQLHHMLQIIFKILVQLLLFKLGLTFLFKKEFKKNMEMVRIELTTFSKRF